jgi:hypothetical protein
MYISNIYIEKEARRIVDELILIDNKENKSLIELYELLLNKKYLKYYYKILIKIPSILANLNYEIIDANNFKIRKIK